MRRCGRSPALARLLLAALLCGPGVAGGAEDLAGCLEPGVVPMAERISKSELTRNFLALTVYAAEPGGPFRRIAELERFPGWTDAGEPVLDADGGWIYAFDHDEAGVGASYYWLLRRAQFAEPRLSPTPRQLAHSMAGVAPAQCGPDLRPTAEGTRAWGEAAPRWCGRVARYLEEWLALAPRYFARPPGPDDPLDLRDPEELWNWMRVMYHHESGRETVLTRATFDRGIRLAADYISAGDRLERPLSDYLHPCEGPVAAADPVPPQAAQPTTEELMQVLGQLDALSASLGALQRQVDALREEVEAMARAAP